MRAMILEGPRKALKLTEIPKPQPSKGQLLIQVHACAVCRTDLHIVDGELTHPHLPLVLGHQIVGVVTEVGEDVSQFKVGDRVGVPWLWNTCGHCKFCLTGRENLCDQALFTGYQVNGGFAEYCISNERFTFSIPPSYSDTEVAPFLCGGLIGYRAYRKTGEAKRLGFYGFGSSAHILTQVAVYQEREVYAFTRAGDQKAQQLALQLGARWAGPSEERPPEPLDAAILFAPVGELVPLALKALDKGGDVICAGIHMSDIPSFPYNLIYQERSVCSVTNLTRQDGKEFLEIAPKIPVKTTTTLYPLEKTNEALNDLREGRLTGSAVVQITH